MPAVAPEEAPVAAHPLRLLAFLCDLALVYLFIALVEQASIFIAGISTQELYAIAQSDDVSQLRPYLATMHQLLAIKAAAFIFASIAFYVGFECSPLHATPGKLLVGLSVIHLVETAITPDSALKRYLVRSTPIWPSIILPNILGVSCIFRGLALIVALLVVFAAFFVMVAEPICVLVTSNRQALHDIFARTQVVRQTSTGFIGACSAFALMVIAAVMTHIIS